MKSQGETTKKVDKIVKVTKDFISSGIGLKKLKSISSIDDYDVIVKNKVQNKTYLIDSSLLGGSGIQTIAEGTNITVDATDPLNPIISATDSASTLFPKGYEFISESRDFLPTDEGKLLVLAAGVTLSMPSEFPFLSNQIVGVNALDSNCYYQDKAGSSVQIFGINNQPNELVVLLSEPDFNSLLPISSPVIDGKTMFKYLYDKSQNAIPLSGTEVGSPVTGDIETYDGFNIHTPNAVNPNKKNGVFLQSSGVSIEYQNNSLSSKIITNENGIEINCDNVGSRGLISGQDFTANITDLDYTQKIYVDSAVLRAIPLSGTEVSNPVTGDIEVFNGFDLKTPNASANEFHSLYMDDGGIQLKYNNSSVANSFIAEDDGFSITSDNASFRGFKGDADYSAAYQVNDYTQLVYVGYRGTATLVSGTITVNTTSIKTGYKIYLSVNTPSGTQGFLSAPTGSIVNETEFVINSTSATDDSTVNWWIAP